MVSARDAARVSSELTDLAPHVTFRIDEEEGDVIIRVLHPETREVLRQIPTAELLEIRRRLDACLGTLADEIA